MPLAISLCTTYTYVVCIPVNDNIGWRSLGPPPKAVIDVCPPYIEKICEMPINDPISSEVVAASVLCVMVWCGAILRAITMLVTGGLEPRLTLLDLFNHTIAQPNSSCSFSKVVLQNLSLLWFLTSSCFTLTCGMCELRLHVLYTQVWSASSRHVRLCILLFQRRWRPAMLLLLLHLNVHSFRLFGNEHVVFYREAASGSNRLAYFLGKNMSHLPYIFLAPLVFLSMTNSHSLWDMLVLVQAVYLVA